MYIERCLQYRHSVTIFDERRVHWLIDAFFFLFFRRLQNQELAHVIQFFLHSDTHCSSPVCSSAFTARLTRYDVSSINSSHRSNDSHRGKFHWRPLTHQTTSMHLSLMGTEIPQLTGKELILPLTLILMVSHRAVVRESGTLAGEPISWLDASWILILHCEALKTSLITT